MGILSCNGYTANVYRFHDSFHDSLLKLITRQEKPSLLILFQLPAEWVLLFLYLRPIKLVLRLFH